MSLEAPGLRQAVISVSYFSGFPGLSGGDRVGNRAGPGGLFPSPGPLPSSSKVREHAGSAPLGFVKCWEVPKGSSRFRLVFCPLK